MACFGAKTCGTVTVALEAPKRIGGKNLACALEV